MDSKELKKRTKDFAISVIKLVETFPDNKSADILGRQLKRAACSVGANYRAACRAQSYSHFISKIGIVEEEADESLYWLELIRDTGVKDAAQLKSFIKEADELTAIFTAIRKTSRAKINK